MTAFRWRYYPSRATSYQIGGGSGLEQAIRVKKEEEGLEEGKDREYSSGRTEQYVVCLKFGGISVNTKMKP
jgi:hypothetical protein